MTVLSACQSAAIRLVGQRPSSIFAADDQFALEMQDLANEVSTDIAKSHDWQAFTALHTIIGDGVTTAFPLPDDYARMLIHADIIDTNNFAWGYSRITDINDWIWITERELQALPGSWILFGNQFQFVPAPADNAEAVFPYIVKNIVLSSGGTPKALFTQDTDTYRLSERLLTLGLVWRWREQKRLDYGADQANFEKAFNEEAGRDKGSRIFRTGPQRFPGDVSLAYPFPLGS